MKFEATLQPYLFDQRHPIHGAYNGYRGRISGGRVTFGHHHHEEYEARLDNGQSFDVLAAPCTIQFVDDKSLKCVVEIDQATVFMLERYGRNTYEKLVELTVAELSRLIGQPQAD